MRMSSRTEDYLRIIYEIIKAKGYARVRDISRALGVKPSTVVEMVKKLDKEGFVVYEKYGGIMLTKRGEEFAEAVKRRHDTFEKFLELILVPEEIAMRDAHILEHQLSPKTISQFSLFVDYIEQSQRESGERAQLVSKLFEEFRKFCEERNEREEEL
jgi:DtxR family Mn-dependent transcriptional regulator